MTTTQAIKLLKNGEAQLCLDTNDYKNLLSIVGEIIWIDVKKYCVLCNGKPMWGDAEFWSFGSILPIIKLSEIEENCQYCEYHTSAAGNETKVVECSRCKGLRQLDTVQKILNIATELIKNQKPKTPNYKYIGIYKAFSEKGENRGEPLRMSDQTEMGRQFNEAVEKELSKKSLMIYKNDGEISQHWKDRFPSVFKPTKETLNKIIQSLKPNTMQVTNNNGEITLNGIKIDAQTADRIVGIRKEQLKKPTLEIWKWYKDKYDRLFCPTEILTDNSCRAYGFEAGSKDYIAVDADSFSWEINGSEFPATDQEVTESLRTEFKKKYKVGDNIQFLSGEVAVLMGYETWLINGKLCAGCLGEWELFDNGQWATIIPTYTHAQIEEKIGKFNYKGE